MPLVLDSGREERKISILHFPHFSHLTLLVLSALLLNCLLITVFTSIIFTSIIFKSWSPSQTLLHIHERSQDLTRATDFGTVMVAASFLRECFHIPGDSGLPPTKPWRPHKDQLNISWTLILPYFENKEKDEIIYFYFLCNLG